MKTISELQHEIRSIRKDLSKMDERLSNIDLELVSFKDSLQNDTSYDHIYNLAEAMPIIHHPIVAYQQETKSIYFGILLMIATLEDSISDQQLLFLQRMVMSDDACKRIDYYMGNLGKLQPENVIFRLSNEAIINHSNQLLLDMIMIAKLGKNCTEKSFGVISDIASVLAKGKEELSEICSVAVALLTQDSNLLPHETVSVIAIDKRYGFYLNEISSWKERLLKVQAEHTELERKQMIKEICGILRSIKG